MKKKDMRKLKEDEQEKKLRDLRLELLKQKGNVEMGGNVKNPGRIRTIKRDIARLLTFKAERENNK